MVGPIEEMGRNTPVNTTPDVYATYGKSGKVEQTASMKSSSVVTLGAQNRAASVVERATEKAQKRDASLCHDDPTLIPGDVVRNQHNAPVTA